MAIYPCSIKSLDQNIYSNCQFFCMVIWFLVFLQCEYFAKHATDIPLSFVLGFYVSQIVARWWAIYMSIPWPGI